jgi:UDP-N-acetyl-alpha-D-muramoyl-L-alanyl-L-glutamate epimerase
LTAQRVLDPQLGALNARGAYNGHVPISACIAFVATLVAYLGGHSSVVVANERSADEGNTTWNGLHINHQWSKSLDFERAFQAWCSRRLPNGPVYFSLLRPLSEVRIAKEFVRYPQYLASFASCNANFRQRPSSEPARWCGSCPKCVFVQLIFAPLMDDATLSSTFGRRFIDDESNRALLEELTGVSGIKPFECVGTASESLGALAMLQKQGRLHGTLASWYLQRWGEQSDSLVRQWHELLLPSGESCIPEAWEKRLHAYLGPDRA